jgi:hypothetical protein
MTYKITSTRQVNDVLFTTVEYNFDGEVLQNEVDHFRPKSMEEIDIKIVNNAQSLLAQKQAIQDIELLMPVIPINEEKPIE